MSALSHGLEDDLLCLEFAGHPQRGVKSILWQVSDTKQPACEITFLHSFLFSQLFTSLSLELPQLRRCGRVTALHTEV